ncbi:DsrE family protein [Ancylomarina sp. DW003]|nr:DsrE family protein [Ancylomarina sp. DW003]MDE5422852.1 DsrE family protein [Ancylomarina sp. DW003]
MKQKFLVVLMSLFLSIPVLKAADVRVENEDVKNKTEMKEADKLVVVWTSGDKEVAMKMVFMYTYNAKKQGWWDDVTLLVWGPSSKLLSEDKDLQDYVKKMQESGVHVMACKACADQYGVANKLNALGIKVKYAGQDLTKFIKERKVVTF